MLCKDTKRKTRPESAGEYVAFNITRLDRPALRQLTYMRANLRFLIFRLVHNRSVSSNEIYED